MRTQSAQEYLRTYLPCERAEFGRIGNTLATFEASEAVSDSANVKAFDHGGIREPVFVDYLEGARYIFDVACGTMKNPREGHTKVYGVLVGDMVIANYQELQRYFAFKLNI